MSQTTHAGNVRQGGQAAKDRRVARVAGKENMHHQMDLLHVNPATNPNSSSQMNRKAHPVSYALMVFSRLKQIVSMRLSTSLC